jgi:hypothetical protein
MGLQRLREKLKGFAQLMYHAVQLASALITIFAATIGATVVASILRLQILLIPLVAFALGTLVALIIIIFTYSKTARSRWLLQGYRWISAEYLYTIHSNDPSHHTQVVTILLHAVRSGVDHFENRYFWTARGQEEEPRILSSGHSLMGPVIQRGGWRYYFIHFGHELTKGEEVEVKIQQELYDREGKFEPFLAKTMSEPVNKLILKVVLPRSFFPLQVTCSEEEGAVPFNNLVKRYPSKINLGNESGEIRWEVDHPVIGHRYEIRWG